MAYPKLIGLIIFLGFARHLAPAAGGESALPVELRAELTKAEYFPYEQIDLLVTVVNTGRVPADVAAADADTTALEFEVVYAATGAPAHGGGMAGVGPRVRPVPEWRKVEKKAPAKRDAPGKQQGAKATRRASPPAAQTGPKRPAPTGRRVVPQAGGLGPGRGGPRSDLLQPGEAASTHWELLSWMGNLQPARYAMRVVWATNGAVVRTSWVPFAVVPFTPAEAEAWEQHMGVLLAPSDVRGVDRGIRFLAVFADSVFRLPVRRELLANAVRTRQWPMAADLGRALYADYEWLAYRWPTPYYLGQALGRLGLREEFDRLLADLTPEEARQIREKLARPDD